jgi:hypothetical protein
MLIDASLAYTINCAQAPMLAVLNCKQSCIVRGYRYAAVFTGNTYQDLPRLREIADKSENYIQCDIRVTNINTVKFN